MRRAATARESSPAAPIAARPTLPGVCAVLRRGLLGVAVLLAVGALQPDGAAQQHYRATGQEVLPAYEGWERNPDGSFNLVFGTMNRNWEETFHIPIGPDNHIAPGGPDRGQPTWFLPRRNRFMFRIPVPADFGDREIVWTLNSPNGKTYRAYATLKPDYFIDDFVVQRNSGLRTRDVVNPNTPPVLEVEGERTRTARVGEAVTLTAFASDDGVPEQRPLRPLDPSRSGNNTVPVTATGLRLSWFVYRGPGHDVTFDPPQTKVWEDTRPNSNSPWGYGFETPPAPPDGKWVARATFGRPGTFILRSLAHDGGLSAHEDITFVVE